MTLTKEATGLEAMLKHGPLVDMVQLRDPYSGTYVVRYPLGLCDPWTTSLQITLKPDNTFYISSVRVHPDYRRNGVATQLVMTALSFIHKMMGDRTVYRVALSVFIDNPSAIALYEKCGFKVSSTPSSVYRVMIKEVIPCFVEKLFGS